jgi:ABC-2 type transport system permease protein
MTAPAVPAPRPAPAGAIRPATLTDALRSEWTKLRTVQSTYWSLLVAAVLAIGLGALISAVSANHYATDPTIHIGWSATDRSFNSLTIAQLAFAVLGVTTITGEYSTGMIRTSLAAVPKRSRMLGAKAMVFGALTLVVGEVIAFVTFLVGQALISGKAPSATLGQPGVLRAVIGAGLYLVLIALLGTGVGTLLRHAAAGIAVMVALLFVLPGIAAALPTSWSQPIEKYWPTNAGGQIYSVGHGLDRFGASDVLGPWAGFALMAGFTALVLLAGFLLLEARDA